ncbi:hypothetical protein ABKY47_004425 [Aeromonas hydrophila]
MNMAYKIVYLEDLDAASIQRNIRQLGFEITHIMPQDNFEDTLKKIQEVNADLLLMDFRLNAGTAKFNAPPFAQFFRSQVIENGRNLPIALISSEENIRDYYRDYTSFDLFDFAVDKATFLNNTEKYCTLFSELIHTYNITTNNSDIGVNLLKIPGDLQLRFDRRLLDILMMEKYINDPFMLSNLLLSSFVKPIGFLIGPDVLSARLGVSIKSKNWNDLVAHLDKFKYNGIYSKTYLRWWAQGIDIWWKDQFPEETMLRKLNSEQRCEIISKKLSLQGLEPSIKPELSNSSRFWTICAGSKKPLDPIDGFEIARDIINSPWLEPEFYSFDYLVNYADAERLKELKEQERDRFSKKVRNE